MKKFTKQLLIGVIALGMLTQIATPSLSSIDNPVNAERHYKRYGHQHHSKNERVRTTVRIDLNGHHFHSMHQLLKYIKSHHELIYRNTVQYVIEHGFKDELKILRWLLI